MAWSDVSELDESFWDSPKKDNETSDDCENRSPSCSTVRIICEEPGFFQDTDLDFPVYGTDIEESKLKLFVGLPENAKIFLESINATSIQNEMNVGSARIFSKHGIFSFPAHCRDYQCTYYVQIAERKLGPRVEKLKPHQKFSVRDPLNTPELNPKYNPEFRISLKHNFVANEIGTLELTNSQFNSYMELNYSGKYGEVWQFLLSLVSGRDLIWPANIVNKHDHALADLECSDAVRQRKAAKHLYNYKERTTRNYQLRYVEGRIRLFRHVNTNKHTADKEPVFLEVLADQEAASLVKNTDLQVLDGNTKIMKVLEEVNDHMIIP